MNPKLRALEVSKEKKALIQRHAEQTAKNLRSRLIYKKVAGGAELMKTLAEEDLNEPRKYRGDRLEKI